MDPALQHDATLLKAREGHMHGAHGRSARWVMGHPARQEGIVGFIKAASACPQQAQELPQVSRDRAHQDAIG